MVFNPIFAVGIVAVITAMTILLLLVMRELAPAGGLNGRARWYLALALGMGVLAFAFKLTLIAYFSWLPKNNMAWWHGTAKALSESSAAGTGYVLPQSHYVWKALPTEAPNIKLNDPTTVERIALGEKLFHDRNLSRDRTVSCASCHNLFEKAGTDAMSTATGINGQKGSRNSPTVWNAAFQSRLFWDGRAASLEAQAKGPPVNPIEMGMPSLDAVVERVKENPAYVPMFIRSFGSRDIDIERIVTAIATFERTLITPDTPYDRFVQGDVQALSAQQVRGMALFEKAGCIRCHSGANFSDGELLHQGTAYRLFPAVLGSLDPKYGLEKDKGAAPADSAQARWRIPSLRNVELTAPYFHNGSVNTLEEAIRIMAKSQLNIHLASEGENNKNILWMPQERTLYLSEQYTLNDQDVADIAAFLRSLSSDKLRKP